MGVGDVTHPTAQEDVILDAALAIAAKEVTTTLITTTAGVEAAAAALRGAAHTAPGAETTQTMSVTSEEEGEGGESPARIKGYLLGQFSYVFDIFVTCWSSEL